MTRREVLKTLAALAIRIPDNACDCHTHIIGDPAKFPLFPGRTYTPEPASPEEMAALHRSLHIKRVVIVTPSVYGTDNSATIYGIKARGATARGIAVIDDHTDLDKLASAGFRGIRLNLATTGQTDQTAARKHFLAAVDRIRKHNWHLQMYTTLPMLASLKAEVLDSPVPVVFDHFGGAQAALGLQQPGFADLVDLLRSGKAYVKISGAYRASKQPPDYADLIPLAKAFIAANQDRVLWGTDWPHPNTTPSREVSKGLPIDDARLLDQLAVWAPDAKTREKILVKNPAALYGF
jgi:predicted TIM-barrel fold metal-dependent hydrolase